MQVIPLFECKESTNNGSQFGDGRNPDNQLLQLRHICFLCNLCKAEDLPQTVEDCINVSLCASLFSFSTSY
jgi:hypothetical protein